MAFYYSGMSTKWNPAHLSLYNEPDYFREKPVSFPFTI